MKGNAKVIESLNVILTGELTAINQYFLHARMLQHWGLGKMGKKEYEASIDEMKHADQLIKRILFLEGLPNLQKYNKLQIGQSVKEVMEADLALEKETLPLLKKFISICEDAKDYVSRDLLVSILASEEQHYDWLNTLLELYEKVGEANFLQSHMDV